MFYKEIESLVLTYPFGSRTYTKKVQTKIIEQDKSMEVAVMVIDTVAIGLSGATPVLGLARKIASRLLTMLDEEFPTEHSLFLLGTSMLHLMAEADLIDCEKYPVIDDNKASEDWYIISTSQDFTEYSQSISPEVSMPSPIGGVREWKSPMMFIEDHRVPLVKKAARYSMLSLYTPEAMPKVYTGLNRLNSQDFIINQFILDLGSTGFGFIPRVIPEDERKMALHSINDISRKAKFIEEIQFKEMNKWLLEEAGVEDEELNNKISKKKASEKSQDYFDTKVEPHQKTISDWSKRLDFENILRLGHSWSNKTINFLFNCDTRGRIYSVQNYLSPLGSDYAKSLLLFAEENQVSGYDLCIHIANCYGQDKLSFADRVEWVNKNSHKLQEIGQDPIGNYKFIEELELEGESKTRWQAIAACRVYADYCNYLDANGTEEGFTTGLIIGLDATASGTQILTMLGRDHRVAPYVNVSNSGDYVGDFYTFLSTYLKPKLEEHKGFSTSLDAVLNSWNKYARKLAKRNSMTFVYSGTKWGFGQQQWEDRHSYGTLGSDLTRADCRLIGNAMYEVCEENIRGGAEIMKWLRQGIDHITDGAVVRWTMPDGFIAFQVADASKKTQLTCEIGTRNMRLVYYKFQDMPKKSEHKNGIAPNWVHSFDAYLLRQIVNGMPEEAPISTVHDQFSTSSYYIEELQATAKEAYKAIADREEAERTCEEAFGIHRELPKVGDWEITEIDEAEFIIC